MECITKPVKIQENECRITDQFYVDDDINVPDSKKDVKKVILSEGTLGVEEIKEIENHIRVSGKLQFKVLYVTDEEEPGLSSLEGKIPYEEMIYVEERPAGNLYVQPEAVELTVTEIHSRKLNIKTLAELSVCSEDQKEIFVTTDALDDEQVYKKFEEKEFLKLIVSKKDTCRIKDELMIDGTRENIGTILWSEVTEQKLDTRLDEGVLRITGELQVFCLYESIEGKSDWLEKPVRYEGMVDCPEATAQMYHYMQAELGDVNLDVRMDEDGEMRRIGIEATLEVRLTVYEEEKIDVLQDIYAVTRKCIPQLKEEQMERLLMQNHSRCKVNERLSLPEIKDDILQICHTSARIQIEHTEMTSEGIQIEGVLHVSFLYIKTNDSVPFGIWQGMVPFSYLIESNETTADMTYLLNEQVEQLAIGLLGGGEIELKAVLAFQSFIKCPVFIQNIESVEVVPIDLEEIEKKPGITGYIVKNGDTLWNLAKHYGTTVEGIMKANQLEKEELREGEKLLIFKESMSIL